MSLSLWVYVDTGGGDSLQSQDDMNATHNLVPMWKRAGVYEALYESEGKRAGDLLSVLEEGVARMQREPLEYQKLNPTNGWGDANVAISFLFRWYSLCRRHPDARIGVSR